MGRSPLQPENRMDLIGIADTLSAALKPMRFKAPVTHVYNPLEYARAAHAEYLSRYARPSCEVMLLGMNPGPWGMAQTGVPFGEVSMVRDWMKIRAPIEKPRREHPKRPVLGLACTRREVSGARLWGWARDTFMTPKRFFDRFFVANYCPLAFMEETGRNHTPDRLPAAQRERLLAACDRALRDMVQSLEPVFVIGVGKFAETRAMAALEGINVTIGRVLHPSPASPAANRGWAPQATQELRAYGIRLPKG